MNKPLFYLMFSIVIFLATSCRENTNSSGKDKESELIIFHAGSLARPIADIKAEFAKAYPQIKILSESSGSLTAARKISELNRPCDIMASADIRVIEELLMPKYAGFMIAFASNEMCVAYNDQSAYAQTVSPENWMHILSRDDVLFGRADPDADPSGYRTLLMFQLSSKYYKMPELFDQLSRKDHRYIRPKSTDLLALMETGSIDYVFLYKSIAKQNDLNIIELPDSVNLSNPELNSFYQKANCRVAGSGPGDSILIRGESMVYGISYLKEAENIDNARLFIRFLLSDRGRAIIEKCGQKALKPEFYGDIKDISEL